MTLQLCCIRPAPRGGPGTLRHAAPAVTGGGSRSSAPISTKGAAGWDGLCRGRGLWVPPPFMGAPSEQPCGSSHHPGSVSVVVRTKRAGERRDTGLRLSRLLSVGRSWARAAGGCRELPSGGVRARAPAGSWQVPSAIGRRPGPRFSPAPPRGSPAHLQQGWKGSGKPLGSSRPLRQDEGLRQGMLQARCSPRADSGPYGLGHRKPRWALGQGREGCEGASGAGSEGAERRAGSGPIALRPGSTHRPAGSRAGAVPHSESLPRLPKITRPESRGRAPLHVPGVTPAPRGQERGRFAKEVSLA